MNKKISFSLILPFLLLFLFSLFFQCAPVKAATLDDINAIGKTNISAKDTATPPINPSLPKAEPGILEKSWAVVKGGIVGGTAGTVAGGAAGTVLGPAGIVVGSSVGRVIGTITGAKNALDALNQKTAAAANTGSGATGTGAAGGTGGSVGLGSSGTTTTGKGANWNGIDLGVISLPTGNFSSLDELIAAAITWLLAAGGALAVLALVVSGIMYITAGNAITSGNNVAQAEKAKKTMVWAITGIIIAFLAIMLVNWTQEIIHGTFSSGGSGDQTINVSSGPITISIPIPGSASTGAATGSNLGNSLMPTNTNPVMKTVENLADNIIGSIPGLSTFYKTTKNILRTGGIITN